VANDVLAFIPHLFIIARKRPIVMCGADLPDLGDENPSEKKEKMNGSAISPSKDGDKKGSYAVSSG
jgi:hypothetical protein